ncbi:DinB family protein [Paractinoplanes ferrugineus]|uniref:Mini-circle protein n=1 Tax=Paractinoplanes ferrugineus TaxID=113564 RepID=A0A919J048_9ACTN|nr:DUF664 domain-containing protein [Actinoplanes ferrugineus]GIE10972.1 mini-circle protein [Actinoplanes ferrugineus]
MTDDTTIQEPPLDAGEVEMLLFALDRSRAQFAWKTGGLPAAALARAHPPTTMTLGGLIKHMALVEERYTIDFSGRPPGPPLSDADRDVPDWEWTTAADDPPELLYSLWRDAVARSRTAMSAALARAGGLAQPALFTSDDEGNSPNLRRIVVDLHDEYARHVGHADLLREAVDGLTGEDPPQKVSATSADTGPVTATS